MQDADNTQFAVDDTDEGNVRSGMESFSQSRPLTSDESRTCQELLQHD